MKIRSDYVSNSSSSSYVIVLPKGYDQYDFINKVVKACSDFRDDDYDEDYIRELNLFNHRQLDFCMNSYELLFIGELEVGWIPGTIDGERQVKEFVQAVNHMKNSNNKYTPMILEKNESHLEYQDLDTVEYVTISKDAMQWHVRPYKWKEVSDEEYRKRVVEAITKVVSRDNRDNPFSHDDSMGICEVTMKGLKINRNGNLESQKIIFDTLVEQLDIIDGMPDGNYLTDRTPLDAHVYTAYLWRHGLADIKYEDLNAMFDRLCTEIGRYDKIVFLDLDNCANVKVVDDKFRDTNLEYRSEIDQLFKGVLETLECDGVLRGKVERGISGTREERVEKFAEMIKPFTGQT